MSSFAEKIAKQNMSPLWEVMSSLITPQPQSNCEPCMWVYDDIRPALMQAGEIISAKEAVRRVLILENTGMPGRSQITTSLYAGLQLVKPGEIAPSHRHSQSALRFVLEGEGAHTAVDGERTYMARGDFVITPAGAWHDHGNTSKGPMVWLDGLDIPMVQFFDASFVEDLGEDEQPITALPQTSRAKFGQGLLPIGEKPVSPTSPIFNYPYAASRQALMLLAQNGEIDDCHGIKLHYAHPLTGGFAMATMATFLQWLPTGFKSAPYKSTDATVFVCVEGSGTSTVGGQAFTWKSNDVFVVPSWHSVTHQIDEQAILFSYSDRAAQEKLGLWKEERLSS